MIELAPALLIPSMMMFVSDDRDYQDAPVFNPLLDYAFPAPRSVLVAGESAIRNYSLLPVGWSMLYNHCSEEDANSSWETARYGVQKATIPNRFSSFAVRIYTTK